MATADDRDKDDARSHARAEALLPEEVAAGTDDAEAQAAAILEESDERAGDEVNPPGPAVEHRRSEDTVELPAAEAEGREPPRATS